MKQTIHVNIGSQAFTMDTDAYNALKVYLDDIRSRLVLGDIETMDDIEWRIAEIFRERLSSPMMVIGIDTVRAAMAQMGSPEAFGSYCGNTSQSERAEEPAGQRKLRRSIADRSIAGVCGGIAEHFSIDPTLIRLITLILILFGGVSIWVYIILWIIIPEAPLPKFNINKNR